MPTDEIEESRAKTPCAYGTCPYYEHGEGEHQALMRQPIQGQLPCVNCFIKPENAPDTSNPQQWQKIA